MMSRVGLRMRTCRAPAVAETDEGACLMFRQCRLRSAPAGRLVRLAVSGLAALLLTGVADPAGAVRRRALQQVETAESRPAGTPLMAIISLSSQRVTIYDADGWIL